MLASEIKESRLAKPWRAIMAGPMYFELLENSGAMRPLGLVLQSLVSLVSNV